VQDDGGVLAQAEGQHGLGVVQHQDHRVRIGRADAADVVEHRLLGLVGAARRLGALEAELDGRASKAAPSEKVTPLRSLKV
jgi:hypothetical protein